MIRQSDSIQLLGTPGGLRLVRTKENIQKVKNHLRLRQNISAGKLPRKLGISATSVRRILKIVLGLKSYKKIMKPSLFDDQKIRQKQFANWIRTNFRKEDILRILFSDEKFFDIDDVYNVDNEHMWAINRADTNEKGGVMEKQEFSERKWWCDWMPAPRLSHPW